MGAAPGVLYPLMSCCPRGNARAGCLINQASISRTPGRSGRGKRDGPAGLPPLPSPGRSYGVLPVLPPPQPIAQVASVVARGGHLHRPHSQGRQAGRSSGAAGDKIYADHQLETRRGDRHHVPDRLARACRRTDRIKNFATQKKFGPLTAAKGYLLPLLPRWARLPSFNSSRGADSYTPCGLVPAMPHSPTSPSDDSAQADRRSASRMP